MKICHVSRGLCPRMVKLAYCQQQAGDDTYWIGQNPPTFQKTTPFDEMIEIDAIRFGLMKKAVDKMNEECDLFHVHTHMRDNFILEEVLKYAKKPYVWDCHDKPDFPLPNPTENIMAPNQELAGDNGLVYNTYCPKGWFTEPHNPTFDLVIATGLSNVAGHYRDWLRTFKTVKEMGYDLFCFTASNLYKDDEYCQVASIREAIDIRELIVDGMSFARAGLCGSPHPDENMLSAWPNKLFEYLAAGIPVICLGSQHAMANFIKAYGIGAVIDSIEDLPGAFQYIKAFECRKRVLEVRHQFTMESQLEQINRFYEKVLK